MVSTRRNALLAGGCAALALLVFSGSASAAVSCTFTPGTGALDVAVTNGTPTVTLSHDVSPSTNLLVNGSSSCSGGTPTDSTTTTITVNESGSSQGTQLTIDFVNGRLAPGTPTEASGTSEIEVVYTADVTGTDVLYVNGSTETADQHFNFGAVGGGLFDANLNADDDADDLQLTGVDRIQVQPGTDNDTFTGDGSGSASFTGPVVAQTVGFASQGNDTFASGSGSNNQFTGGLGNDTATGGPNMDSMDMALGDDTFDGGGGSQDYASYEGDASATGVTLDLSQTGPQNTGDQGMDQVTNVENVVGSNGSDHLTGTSGVNTMFGGNLSLDAGNDFLDGGGGGDELIGWDGNDVLNGGQGNDVLEGDAGTDTASYARGSTGPVSMDLDLAKTGVAQATGGAGNDTLADGVQPSDPDPNHEIENLIGSPFAGDVLTGNTIANQIDAYDGLADTVDCVAAGDGDTAILDELGVDTVSNCETIDNAPQTSIDSGPTDGATITSATPTYELSADEPSSFQVSVDAGQFQACSASCTVPALTGGTHTLAFRAVDLDDNLHPDLSPATRTLTVSLPVVPDTTPPETSIGSHPKPKTKKRTATFTFTSSEAGSTFLCSYDGKPYVPCSGSFTTPKLSRGKHRFDVIATDSAGNRDQSAATFSWKIKKRKRR
jgi:Ca2+-binding RTX toxin-like protein